MRNEQKKTQYAEITAREQLYFIVSHGDAPFSVATVGVTYPNPEYRITRTATKTVHVLEYILEGEGEITVGGKHFTASAGDSYLLRSREAHTYRSDRANPWKKLWINYTADYLPAYLDALRLETGVRVCPHAREVFERAFAAAQNASHEEAARTVTECVHEILRLFQLAARSITRSSF